jgi:hypothetical protein
MTYGSPVRCPIVPPARGGHRWRSNEADKYRIVEEASQPGASLSEVAHADIKTSVWPILHRPEAKDHSAKARLRATLNGPESAFHWGP